MDDSLLYLQFSTTSFATLLGYPKLPPHIFAIPPLHLPLHSVSLSTSPRSLCRPQPWYFVPPFTSSVPRAAVPLPSAHLPEGSHPSAVPAVTMATSARMLCRMRMRCGMRMRCRMWSLPRPSARGQAIQLEPKQLGEGRWGGYDFPPNGN